MNAQPQSAQTQPVITFRVFRDHWKAINVEATVMLDATKQLRLNTSKNSSGVLVSLASVGHLTPGGGLTMVLFQDFSKRVASSRPSRITEKVAREQHAAIDLEALVAEAKAFYGVQ